MKQIRISPAVQLAALTATLGLAAAAVGASMPEIRRYLKIKSM